MTETAPTKRPLLRKPAIAALWCVTIITALGLVIRLTVRDHLPGLSIVFYITPLPLLTVACFFAASGWFIRGRKYLGACFLIISLPVSYWMLDTCFVSSGTDSKMMNLRVLLWNTAHGGFHGIQPIAESADDYGADIIGIVEGDSRGIDDEVIWHNLFPEYESSGLHSGILLLTRGEIHDFKMYPLTGRGRVLVADTTLHDELIRVAVIDIDPNIVGSRQKSVRRLVSVLDGLGEPPDLLLGDFNTPADSPAMDMLRNRYAHAFEEHGSGYAPTWPIPMPVLQLDHIWIGPKITGLKCVAGWTMQSDHRPVLLEATIKLHQE